MGSMITSIDEFAKYVAFHLSAWPPSNAAEKGPVKRSSVREMHHPWRWNGFNPNFNILMEEFVLLHPLIVMGWDGKGL
jgi:hypothetical protein